MLFDLSSKMFWFVALCLFIAERSLPLIVWGFLSLFTYGLSAFAHSVVVVVCCFVDICYVVLVYSLLLFVAVISSVIGVGWWDLCGWSVVSWLGMVLEVYLFMAFVCKLSWSLYCYIHLWDEREETEEEYLARRSGYSDVMDDVVYAVMDRDWKRLIKARNLARPENVNKALLITTFTSDPFVEYLCSEMDVNIFIYYSSPHISLTAVGSMLLLTKSTRFAFLKRTCYAMTILKSPKDFCLTHGVRGLMTVSGKQAMVMAINSVEELETFGLRYRRFNPYESGHEYDYEFTDSDDDKRGFGGYDGGYYDCGFESGGDMYGTEDGEDYEAPEAEYEERDPDDEFDAEFEDGSNAGENEEAENEEDDGEQLEYDD
jgi:hypothetical protein